MSVFKSLTTSDVILSPFKVNKSFSFTGCDTLTGSNAGIDRFVGENITYVSGSDETGQIVTQSKALIYNSVKQLYYTNYLSGSNGSPVLTSSIGIDGVTSGQNGPQPSYDNFLPNTLLANRVFPTGSGTNGMVGVISIPSNLFGEYIQPGSINIFGTGGFFIPITDDGEGGLIASGVKIGDVIYEQGMLIVDRSKMTSQGFGRLITQTGNAVEPTIQFSSSMTIHESQYKCTFSPNEFTYTQNPTIISGSSSGKVYDFATGSYFEPYITTVGLYNRANQLVAVGKLSQPLQSSNISDTTILVNLDL